MDENFCKFNLYKWNQAEIKLFKLDRNLHYYPVRKLNHSEVPDTKLQNIPSSWGNSSQKTAKQILIPSKILSEKAAPKTKSFKKGYQMTLDSQAVVIHQAYKI